MTRITDTQALILSAAALRPGRIALPLPDGLRGGAAAKVVGSMLAKGLILEVDADLRLGEPLWRETGDGHGVTLVATDAGLAAVGIEPEGADSAPVGAAEGLSAGTVPAKPPLSPKPPPRRARRARGPSRRPSSRCCARLRAPP